MSKTLVIIQSNYLPWRGYFDMLRRADQVVLLDSVQYTRQDWRNRNAIKHPQGLRWITIPVSARFHLRQSIDQTPVADTSWAERHIRAIEFAYRPAAAFDAVSPWLFDNLRGAASLQILADINRHLLFAVCEYLSISTPLTRCVEILPRTELVALEPSARLVRLCQATGATRYLTGPAAKNYLDQERLENAGIEVEYMTYEGYPQYPQCWAGFEPRVSIVDLLLNCGPESADYLNKPS